MKFRDKVRYKDQAGVPANLRATDTLDRKPPKKAARSNSKTFWDIDARKASILRWVREHPGQLTNFRELSAIAGYVSELGSWPTVYQLIDEGRLRKAPGRKVKLYPVTLAEDLPKGGERNGDVISYATKQPSEKAVKEAEEFLEAAKQKTAERLNTKSSEEVFVENLDRFIWDFLKTYKLGGPGSYGSPTIGDATLALREFSSFMSKQITKEDTDAKKEEAPDLRQEKASGDN